MLFYIYNHDVTLTLYIKWTVFLHKFKLTMWKAAGLSTLYSKMQNYQIELVYRVFAYYA